MDNHLKCTICQDDFDLKDKCPHVINNCGHSLCRECIKNHIDKTKTHIKYNCPICRRSQTYRKESDFPAQNISLKDEIEQRMRIKQ